MKKELLFVSILLFVFMTGCDKSDTSSEGELSTMIDSIFLLAGNIQYSGELPFVSGQSFGSPITIFVNDNPIDIVSQPSLIWIDEFMSNGQNEIRISGITQDMDIGIFQQSLRACKTVFKKRLRLSDDNRRYIFNVEIPCINPLYSDETKLPDNQEHASVEILKQIERLYDVLHNREGEQAAAIIHHGQSVFLRACGYGDSEMDTWLEIQNEKYSSNAWDIRELDLAQCEFVWGEKIVLVYRKTTTGPNDVFEFDWPTNISYPMPGITFHLV